MSVKVSEDLLDAMTNNDILSVALLLSKLDGINEPKPELGGETLLHHAVENNFCEVINLLEGIGANIDLAGAAGKRALHTACESESIETVKMLIDLGADVNALTLDGKTPLHTACQTSNAEITHMLLSQGADPNRCSYTSALSALHISCDQGFVDGVRSLLEHEARVDLVDRSGDTALHIACWHGSTECSRLLIAQGADINAQGSLGHTPLHLACLFNRNNKELLKFLLESGANTQIKDTNGLKPSDLVVNQKAKNMIDTFTTDKK